MFGAKDFQFGGPEKSDDEKQSDPASLFCSFPPQSTSKNVMAKVKVCFMNFVMTQPHLFSECLGRINMCKRRPICT